LLPFLILVLPLGEQSLHHDPAVRRRALAFVTAGGGFSGVETAGAINDLVGEAARYYPELSQELVRVIIVHPGEVLLVLPITDLNLPLPLHWSGQKTIALQCLLNSWLRSDCSRSLSYSVSVPPSWASNRRVTGVVIVWPRVAVFGTGHGGEAVNQDKQ